LIDASSALQLSSLKVGSSTRLRSWRSRATRSSSNTVPYLMNRVGFQVADEFEARLGGDLLSVPMWRILAVLRSGSASRVSDLAEPTSIEPSTLSRLVKTLERRGFVKRDRSLDDERAVAVSLTAAGKKIIERLIPIARTMEDELLADLEPAEIAVFKVLLSRLHRRTNGAPS